MGLSNSPYSKLIEPEPEHEPELEPEHEPELEAEPELEPEPYLFELKIVQEYDSNNPINFYYFTNLEIYSGINYTTKISTHLTYNFDDHTTTNNTNNPIVDINESNGINNNSFNTIKDGFLDGYKWLKLGGIGELGDREIVFNPIIVSTDHDDIRVKFTYNTYTTNYNIAEGPSSSEKFKVYYQITKNNIPQGWNQIKINNLVWESNHFISNSSILNSTYILDSDYISFNNTITYYEGIETNFVDILETL